MRHFMLAFVAALLLAACASTKPDMAALKPTEDVSTAVVKITYPTGATDYVSRKEFEQARDKLMQPGTPEQFILDFLASRRLMLQEARGKNVSADPKEVDQFLERIKTSNCSQAPDPAVRDEKDPAKQLNACANFFGFDGTAGLRRYLQDQLVITKLIEQAAQPAKTAQAATVTPPTEEFRAAHILLKTEAEAQKARERVTTGKEDFGKVAKEISIDPSAKQNSGDLGFTRPGTLVPEFEKAVAALKEGEISQPVQTQFGWHIIKLIARRKLSPEAQQQAAQQAQQAQQQAEQQAQQQASAAYQQALLAKAKQEGRVQYLITPKPPATQAPQIELPTVQIEPETTATPSR